MNYNFSFLICLTAMFLTILKISKFIHLADLRLSRLMLSFALLVMNLTLSLASLTYLLMDGFLSLNAKLFLLFGCVVSVIMVLHIRKLIFTLCRTCLRQVCLKSVLSKENITVFQFSMSTRPWICFLMIDYPSEECHLIGFVPDFVIHHCLILVEDYAKKNFQVSR